jgi:eukaryotic-like serine/threonine-protein kinase
VTIAPAFNIGDVIAGKYRIDEILGSGGMGIVVAARHLSLDDVVAIKFLSAELANDAHAVSRFDREARAAAKIKSEYVARVFDVDRLPNGSPYMVMEYLQGADLSTLIEDGTPLAEERAVTFVLQACMGLSEAHAAGIVHRDIKPSNLFCVQRPNRDFTIKVFDFGISKLTLSSDSMKAVITGTGAAVGSPAYMSPEQMRSSADVDPRTDIWSLGVVLYELLTGKLPFTGTSYPELCLKIAGAAPTPPREHRPDLSVRLEQVIAKCLEKERDRRFTSVGELAEALLPSAPAAAYIVEGIHVPAALAQTASSTPPAPAQVSTLPLAPSVPADTLPHGKSTVTDATWTHAGPRSEPPKAQKFRLIGAAFAVGLLFASAGIWSLRSRREPPGVPTASAAQPTPMVDSEPLPTSSPPHALPPNDLGPAVDGNPANSAASASSAKTQPPLSAPQVSTKPVSTSTSAPASQRSKNPVWNRRD